MYPSRDYWNDNAQYEQIFGESFAGHYPNVKNDTKTNSSRILATNIYSDDNNNMTSIKLECSCDHSKKKEPWNY